MKICPVCKSQSPPTAEFCPKDGTILPEDDGTGTGTRMLYDPLIGELIDGRYKIETRLGEGALSTVYAATHELIEKRVALKVLKQEFVADEEIVERFLREAKAASRLNHEHIISLSDFGKVPSGAPFFVMELLDGRNLSDLLYEGKGLPVPEALRLVTEIGRGLAAAHQHGVVHRDLKPENIGLVRDEDGVEHVKILDFGLAKIAQANRKLTRAGQVLGTPEYMSPEQASGTNVDHRSDVFSLGILLYRMITGQVPFGGASFMAVISRLLSERPRPPRSLCDAPELNEALEEVILRALARDPQDRYPTMDALLEALRLAPSGVVAPVPPPPQEPDAVASTWVDPGPSAKPPPPLEEQAIGPTAVAEVVPEEVDVEIGPTELMPSVDGASTVPEVDPPAAMQAVAEDTPTAPAVPPVPAQERVARASADAEETLGNLRIEQHTAQRLIRRSARAQARRRVVLISAIIGLLGVAGGVLLAVVLSGGPSRPSPGAGGEQRADSPPPMQRAARDPGLPHAPSPRQQPRARRASPRPVTTPRTIRLVLRSTPTGATVFLDNKAAGRTPLTRDIPAGPRNVTVGLFKQGYRPQYRKFRAERDTAFTVPLVRARVQRTLPRAMAAQPRPRPMRPANGALRDLKDPFATMKP